MDGTGGQMKTFCKAHDAEPGGILCTAPKVSSPRRSPAGHQQRRKGALRAAAGQSQRFLAERLRRAERHDPAVLHLGAGTDKAPPQPLERHANLPGIGVQRFDRSAQAGPGQARPHHAELPGGRKTHSAERGWCKTVRLKVQNRPAKGRKQRFFCSASSANHRGMSFPITTQQSVSMRLQK